ncbi:single-stranded DNA-binding protein [Streptomyces sp. NPDC053079]|uniref:single-stranded DNA-binding protein n=1 Tax=Streptomyces sp. NPDC053079 TaxID=3365697 RepID=UPI0037D19C01
MNETLVTVVGNVATQPDFREAANGAAVSRFRLAATVRRWDRQREEWADAYTSFYTVWAWRALAGNVVGSVTVGEPLIVQGKLRIQEQERDGKRWVSADIDAVSIGHDLARGTSAFRRVSPARPLPLEPVRMAGADPGPGRGASGGQPPLRGRVQTVPQPLSEVLPQPSPQVPASAGPPPPVPVGAVGADAASDGEPDAAAVSGVTAVAVL